MKTILITVLFHIISFSTVVATKQRADFMEYQSRLYKFGFYRGTPLEDYFSSTKTKPPKLFISDNSNFKRGHIGHWRVYNKKLWLVAIYVREGVFSYDSSQPLADLVCFPLQKIFSKKGPVVHAAWFSGKITVYADGRANLLNDRPDKDNPVYSLTFEKGILVKSKKL